MKQRYDFGYFISEGFHSIFTHGFMSFAAVCMIVCCLLIMGSFSLVAVNVDHMLGKLEDENEFTAFVQEDYSAAQTNELMAELRAIPNVASVTYVSREDAMSNYKADHQEQLEVLDTLPDTVLRDRFRIHVVDIELMGETSEQVENTEGIAKIRVELELAEGFVVMRNIASVVAIILVIILLMVSLFIIVNTIKLATFNRREEIAIMKMCGATNSFIRWPFVFEGMLLGLAGALAAFFLMLGAYTLVANAITASDTIALITIVPFGAMAKWVLFVFLGTGLVIGAGGSVLAIHKFLQV